MSATIAPVPVTIAPEVHAYVAELGMQAEFEQMLEHIRQNVAHLGAIVVSVMEPYDAGDVPHVIFDAHLTREGPISDGTRSRWHE